MKTNRILSIAMTLAMGMIAGLQASVTEHQPPAPLPEFKTPEQLAKWRTETTARTSAQEVSRPSTLDSSTPFYTGKPYLAESGSYAFKYREYNPEMGRWTTVDPSGFPDGANALSYCKNTPVNGFDWQGMQTVIASDEWYQTWQWTMNSTQAIGSGLTAISSVYVTPLGAAIIVGGLGIIGGATSYTDPIQILSLSTYNWETFSKQVKLIDKDVKKTSILTWETESNEYHMYITTFTKTEDRITTYHYE